jgi:hypothetical protein
MPVYPGALSGTLSMRTVPDTLPPQGMKLNELLKACFDTFMKVGKE